MVCIPVKNYKAQKNATILFYTYVYVYTNLYMDVVLIYVSIPALSENNTIVQSEGAQLVYGM